LKHPAATLIKIYKQIFEEGQKQKVTKEQDATTEQTEKSDVEKFYLEVS